MKKCGQGSLLGIGSVVDARFRMLGSLGKMLETMFGQLEHLQILATNTPCL